MSKREKFSGADPFGLGGSETGEVSFEHAADALFGGKRDAAPEVLKQVAIEQIYPDPTQPRRTLPSSVRARVTIQPDHLPDVFNIWIGLIEEESQRELSIDSFLQGSDPVERSDQTGPIEAAFLDLVELAASIRRDGLTNAITVARMGRNYRLETGERRWMAYHLLHSYFNGRDGKPDESDRWSKIPARVMDTMNVWRQATENTARQNLNAIGRARQFSLLLMDVLGSDQFQPFDQFEHERDFYAQVADGNTWRIPRGSGEMLLNAMGLKNESQLRYYRALLRLPVEVWRLADDYNTSVRTLRVCLQQSAGDEAKLIQLIERARRSETVSMDTLSDDTDIPNQSQDPPTPPTKETPAPGSKAFFSLVARALDRVGEGKPKDNQRAWDMLEKMESWIQEQKQQVSKYLK